jgi:hypothetical protein
VAPPVYRPISARIFQTTPRSGGTGGRIGGVREHALAHRVGQRVVPLVRTLRPGGRRLVAPYAGNGYGHQVKAVQAALGAGATECAVMPLAESVDIMRLIDDARGQWQS